MILRKAKTLCLPVVCCMALALVLFQAPAKCYGEDEPVIVDVDIDVSPNVLNIQSKSTVVTVHTDIAYELVVGASVFLNGVAIDWWKSDDRGNFVAKFESDEIKTLEGLIFGELNTLDLVGETKTGDSFFGTQDILVIDNVPAGAGKK